MPFIYLLDYLTKQFLVSIHRTSSDLLRKAAHFYGAQEEHLPHRLEISLTYLSELIFQIHVDHLLLRCLGHWVAQVSCDPRVSESHFSWIPIYRFKLCQPLDEVLTKLWKFVGYLVPWDRELLPDFGFVDWGRVALSVKRVSVTNQFEKCYPEWP